MPNEPYSSVDSTFIHLLGGPVVSLKRYLIVRNIVIFWMTCVILAAFLLPIPKINILEHTARNLYFHVPMRFAMM
ncbi:MAG: hypothetical protein O2797_08540, partial [Bacteroidetes bacterium]|nr:hypothetical protein [Bacteroidota bacterium]